MFLQTVGFGSADGEQASPPLAPPAPLVAGAKALQAPVQVENVGSLSHALTGLGCFATSLHVVMQVGVWTQLHTFWQGERLLPLLFVSLPPQAIAETHPSPHTTRKLTYRMCSSKSAREPRETRGAPRTGQFDADYR
jgi:hypothetical protein